MMTGMQNAVQNTVQNAVVSSAAGDNSGMTKPLGWIVKITGLQTTRGAQFNNHEGVCESVAPGYDELRYRVILSNNLQFDIKADNIIAIRQTNVTVEQTAGANAELSNAPNRL